MHRIFAFGSFGLICALLVGCADVPEHELYAVLEYDGTQYEGVIAFPDHDDEFRGGDGSCGLTSGNCGDRTRTQGSLVSGDLPFEGATIEGDADSQTYDVYLRRSPDDQAAEDVAAKNSPVPRNRFSCRVYGSNFGERVECYGTTKHASIVVTER